MNTNASRMDEIRELTADELYLVSGGVGQQIAAGAQFALDVANALVGGLVTSLTLLETSRKVGQLLGELGVGHTPA